MLAQLKARVRELNTLADEVFILAERFGKEDATAQPDLAIKGQQWFRGTRELLVQQKYSGLKDFDLCYSTPNNYMDIGAISILTYRSTRSRGYRMHSGCSRKPSSKRGHYYRHLSTRSSPESCPSRRN